jgi:carbonic anhydrase
MLVLGALAVMASACSQEERVQPVKSHPSGGAVPTTDDAWKRLLLGNERFAQGKQIRPRQELAWRQAVVDKQTPFACVLGCVDSRVTPEIVFDQGLGDLLTVRTAGEVLDDAVIGSIEFGVHHLHIPLVVVLGHSNCGAVQATIDVVKKHESARGEVSALIRAIEASVLATPENDDAEAFLAACVDEQARRMALELHERSEVVADAVEAGKTRVIAATYDLQSGKIKEL